MKGGQKYATILLPTFAPEPNNHTIKIEEAWAKRNKKGTKEIDRAHIFTWNLQQAGRSATVCRPLDQYSSHFADIFIEIGHFHELLN